MQISANPPAAATSDLQAVEVAQRSAASEPQALPTKIVAIDPSDHTRLNKYLEAMGAPLHMGQDASSAAHALVSTMQSIIIERPDLATASFDFRLDHGTLKVVSGDLNAADKAWLEAKLNGNAGLVDAATAFRDDAVKGYALWADANGHPLTDEQLDAVSQRAENLTGFLQLFSNLGADMAQRMLDDGAYYAPDGAHVSFDQSPKTAIGFLAFMQSAEAVSDGSARWAAPNGTTHYGVLKADVFANNRVIPNFFPSGADSLGVNETA